MKWEYLHVTGFRYIHTTIIPPDGKEYPLNAKDPRRPGDADWSLLLAQLGEDGWELCGTLNDQGILFFKRPKA